MKMLSLALALLFVLGAFSSACATEQSGKAAIGGYGGYSKGFSLGKFFESTGYGQNEVDFSFGFKAHFGLNRITALAVIWDYQAGGQDREGLWPPNFGPQFVGIGTGSVIR
jgi:hypothetical protein